MRTVTPQGFNQDDILHFKNFKQTQYAGHKKIPTAVCWNPSGDKLVVAQTSVKIWNFDLINGCEKISESKMHQNNVETIKFGTNHLVGTLSKQSLRFWDIRQSPLKPGKVQKKAKSDLISFCWNISGSKLQTVSEENLKYCLLTKDNTLTVNDFRNQSKPLNTINLKNINSMQVSQISWDQTNSFFMCAGGESSTGSIVLLDGQTFEQIPQGVINSHCSRINDLALSFDNSLVATTSDDSLVQILEFPEFICERSYTNKSDSSTRKVSFSHNAKYLAVATDGDTIDIFNVKYGGLAHRIETQVQRQSVQWHPKRQILCYIDEKRKINKNQKSEESFINILQPMQF